MSEASQAYRSSTVSPPGDTLQELLDDLGMSQAELAERMGRPKKLVNEIIKGKAAITSETALQLERVLGAPAGFWLQRERSYREALAREDDRTELERHAEWAKAFPLRAMARLRWIDRVDDPVEQLRVVLGFFGIATPDQWAAQAAPAEARLRRSAAFEQDTFALNAWLRRAEIEAQRIECAPFDPQSFKSALMEARSLTLLEPAEFSGRLQSLCAGSGVALVLVPELPKTRVCGASRWLSGTKALIALSLRYKSDGQFWFSFYHEAGHLHHHGRRETFIDEVMTDAGGADERRLRQEGEADRFAADFLVPRRLWTQLAAAAPYISKDLVESIAAAAGVAPGIVVGRLQHDGLLGRDKLNRLKRRFDWSVVDPTSDARPTVCSAQEQS